MFRNTYIWVLAIFVVFVGYCPKNVQRNHNNGDCDETCGRILMRSTKSFVRLHHCPLIRGPIMWIVYCPYWLHSNTTEDRGLLSAYWCVCQRFCCGYCCCCFWSFLLLLFLMMEVGGREGYLFLVVPFVCFFPKFNGGWGGIRLFSSLGLYLCIMDIWRALVAVTGSFSLPNRAK